MVVEKTFSSWIWNDVLCKYHGASPLSHPPAHEFVNWQFTRDNWNVGMMFAVGMMVQRGVFKNGNWKARANKSTSPSGAVHSGSLQPSRPLPFNSYVHDRCCYYLSICSHHPHICSLNNTTLLQVICLHLQKYEEKGKEKKKKIRTNRLDYSRLSRFHNPIVRIRFRKGVKTRHISFIQKVSFHFNSFVP